MILKKNEIVNVKHKRLGDFTGIVARDFDTDKEEFYPINLAQDDPVYGISHTFSKGDSMPCRNILTELIVIVSLEEKSKNVC